MASYNTTARRVQELTGIDQQYINMEPFVDPSGKSRLINEIADELAISTRWLVAIDVNNVEGQELEGLQSRIRDLGWENLIYLPKKAKILVPNEDMGRITGELKSIKDSIYLSLLFSPALTRLHTPMRIVDTPEYFSEVTIETIIGLSDLDEEGRQELRQLLRSRPAEAWFDGSNPQFQATMREMRGNTHTFQCRAWMSHCGKIALAKGIMHACDKWDTILESMGVEDSGHALIWSHNLKLKGAAKWVSNWDHEVLVVSQDWAGDARPSMGWQVMRVLNEAAAREMFNCSGWNEHLRLIVNGVNAAVKGDFEPIRNAIHVEDDECGIRGMLHAGFVGTAFAGWTTSQLAGALFNAARKHVTSGLHTVVTPAPWLWLRDGLVQLGANREGGELVTGWRFPVLTSGAVMAAVVAEPHSGNDVGINPILWQELARGDVDGDTVNIMTKEIPQWVRDQLTIAQLAVMDNPVQAPETIARSESIDTVLEFLDEYKGLPTVGQADNLVGWWMLICQSNGMDLAGDGNARRIMLAVEAIIDQQKKRASVDIDAIRDELAKTLGMKTLKRPAEIAIAMPPQAKRNGQRAILEAMAAENGPVEAGFFNVFASKKSCAAFVQDSRSPWPVFFGGRRSLKFGNVVTRLGKEVAMNMSVLEWMRNLGRVHQATKRVSNSWIAQVMRHLANEVHIDYRSMCSTNITKVGNAIIKRLSYTTAQVYIDPSINAFLNEWRDLNQLEDPLAVREAKAKLFATPRKAGWLIRLVLKNMLWESNRGVQMGRYVQNWTLLSQVVPSYVWGLISRMVTNPDYRPTREEVNREFVAKDVVDDVVDRDDRDI